DSDASSWPPGSAKQISAWKLQFPVCGSKPDNFPRPIWSRQRQLCSCRDRALLRVHEPLAAALPRANHQHQWHCESLVRFSHRAECWIAGSRSNSRWPWATRKVIGLDGILRGPAVVQHWCQSFGQESFAYLGFGIREAPEPLVQAEKYQFADSARGLPRAQVISRSIQVPAMDSRSRDTRFLESECACLSIGPVFEF